jgi:septal ring factor EnvC (AmiA/AmiB activator)
MADAHSNMIDAERAPKSPFDPALLTFNQAEYNSQLAAMKPASVPSQDGEFDTGRIDQVKTEYQRLSNAIEDSQHRVQSAERAVNDQTGQLREVERTHRDAVKTGFHSVINKAADRLAFFKNELDDSRKVLETTQRILANKKQILAYFLASGVPSNLEVLRYCESVANFDRNRGPEVIQPGSPVTMKQSMLK